jgi:hypothetical protein
MTNTQAIDAVAILRVLRFEWFKVDTARAYYAAQGDGFRAARLERRLRDVEADIMAWGQQ